MNINYFCEHKNLSIKLKTQLIMNQTYLRSLCIALISLVFIYPSLSNPKRTLRLWYDRPANVNEKDRTMDDKFNESSWLDALPIGNGYLGAMVYGGADTERIQLNEKTLWSGSYSDSDNPDAYENLETIQDLLNKGLFKQGSDLAMSTFKCKGPGSGYGFAAKNKAPYGSFQTLGDLWLEFDQKGDIRNYHRELDLNKGIIRVSYTQGNNDFTREYFISYPDNAMVIRIKSKLPHSYKAYLNRPERSKSKIDNNTILMSGTLDSYQNTDGMSYWARLGASSNKGKISYEQDSLLIIKDTKESILVLTAETNYQLKYKDYINKNHTDQTLSRINKIRNQGYQTSLKKHTNDYQQLFNRVSFSLNSEEPDTIPTDRRVNRFKKQRNDKYLQELYYQYGRYLLIASSRPGSLPANLQGIWSNKLQTAWNGDYHANINVQMNYWPAEITNLSELHLPLCNLIESLVEPGQRTAQVHYKANGWCMHPITNVWGYTAPGEGGLWGIHIGAAGWLCQHLWEHYDFSRDTTFLKRIYPVLLNASLFYLDWLKYDPKTGEYLSGPSASPENAFIAPDGTNSAICMAPAHDQQIIHELFDNTLKAAEILNLNDSTTNKIKQTLPQLAKSKIGKDGRLMEWNEEFGEVEPGHRHMSHLYALHPGNQINETTPDLMEAARKSIDFRLANGGGHTGWSMAWLINMRARLGQGEEALDSYNSLLAKCTLNNLFDNHGPFQIDGNFGGTAGVTEMLLQSHADNISLLPALPQDWAEGSISGLVARGGYVIDIKWDKSLVTYARIKAKTAGQAQFKINGKVYNLTFKPNEVKEIKL